MWAEGGALWVSEDIAVPGEGGTGTALRIPASGLPWFPWTCRAGVVDLDGMLQSLPRRWAQEWRSKWSRMDTGQFGSWGVRCFQELLELAG